MTDSQLIKSNERYSQMYDSALNARRLHTAHMRYTWRDYTRISYTIVSERC